MSAGTPETGGVVAAEAEIVGHVWQVAVVPGDRVSAGQTVAVLESMKMEIPIPAPVAGVVERVVAPVGSLVQEGDPVVLLVASP